MSNMVGKTEQFFAFLSYDRQTFSFPHCISTLFIWCCRVFAWWTRVLWEHHETLVFIEKMGAIEQLWLRAPKSLI